jgi:hypothetical protein
MYYTMMGCWIILDYPATLPDRPTYEVVQMPAEEFYNPEPLHGVVRSGRRISLVRS